MSNTLKCKYPTTWNGMDIVEMPINLLHQSVPVAEFFCGKQFYSKIKEDIATNGLHFPLLVVEAKYWQYLEQYNIHTNKLLPPPTGFNNTDTIYVVWGGSNRLHIAIELGYSLIDCVIFKNGNFKAAWEAQALHRQPFSQYYTK